jgi:GTPase
VLVVGSNMGVQVMTREHISIASALNIPLFVCLTKMDICPENVLKSTRRTLAKLLRDNGTIIIIMIVILLLVKLNYLPLLCLMLALISFSISIFILISSPSSLAGKMPYPVKDMDAVHAAADSIVSDRIIPVFSISSVTGQGFFHFFHFDLCMWFSYLFLSLLFIIF